MGLYQCFHVFFDENNACFTAIEAGKLIFFFYTYSSMKITRVSLQSRLDELIQMQHTYLLMKIPHVSLQSKLDELMSLLHTYLLIKITCVAIESVHPGSIAVKQALFHRRIRIGLDNDISSSSFDCNDTRIIFINRYVRSN